jgi:hypothetical protein
MRQAFTERMRQHFLSHPGVWFDARELEVIGGRCAWRTRLSETRRFYGMTIENRQVRQKASDGTVWVQSQYRYVPHQPLGRDAGELFLEA